ncbi:hypothetical protein E2C01_046685 [Portunus trituberculatus]|uniref:Uncharacterized protein n=1 Tax=Portunus trituberculatus TaxID=210409 RepID=A0A5B7G6U2_PORTR|nr:hypothetical protein [Portunus trituberculatus]
MLLITSVPDHLPSRTSHMGISIRNATEGGPVDCWVDAQNNRPDTALEYCVRLGATTANRTRLPSEYNAIIMFYVYFVFLPLFVPHDLVHRTEYTPLVLNR